MATSPLERTRASPVANLLAGGAGGLASLVVGHPFDTVKVRLQTMQSRGGSLPYSSATDCLRKVITSLLLLLLQMVRLEGPLALYRGMSGLALFSVPRFALMFYANSWGRVLAARGQDQQLPATLSQVRGRLSTPFNSFRSCLEECSPSWLWPPSWWPPWRGSRFSCRCVGEYRRFWWYHSSRHTQPSSEAS